jgi:hypothetical protein
MFEQYGIYFYCCWGKRNSVPFENETTPIRAGLPDGRNGLSKALAGLLLRFVSPEQRRHLIPRMRLSRPESEIGQKRLGFLRRKGQARTRRESALKPSK